jgi:hypothetical protein
MCGYTLEVVERLIDHSGIESEESIQLALRGMMLSEHYTTSLVEYRDSPATLTIVGRLRNLELKLLTSVVPCTISIIQSRIYQIDRLADQFLMVSSLSMD